MKATVLLSVTASYQEAMEGQRTFGFCLNQSRGNVPFLNSQKNSPTPPPPSYPLSAPLSDETKMSENSMASTSSFSSPTIHDDKRLDPKSVQGLIISVNQHILQFLADPEKRNSLKLRCTSKLKIQKQEFFEFSEQSVLSNLYWGIMNVESAIQAKCPDERGQQLKKSEQMLQVPALLNDHGSTGGIPNWHLVCCAYFYLSLVRKLQQDKWQVTLHFLQAILVSPWLVRTEFAPELWESLFLSQIMSRRKEGGQWRSLLSESPVNFGEDAIDEATRQLARRYKDWLMYYHVMLYGQRSRWHWGCEVSPLPGEESQSCMYEKSTSKKYLDLVEYGNTRPYFQNFEKVHPLDLQENVIDEMEDKVKASIVSSEQKSNPLHDDRKNLSTKLDEVRIGESNGGLGIKCLHDMLEVSQSDTPISVYSHHSTEGSYSEAEIDYSESSDRMLTINTYDPDPEIDDRQLQASCSTSDTECIKITPDNPGCPKEEEVYEANTSYFFCSRYCSSFRDLSLSDLEPIDTYTQTFCDVHVEEEETLRRLQQHGFRLFDHILSTSLHQYHFTQLDNQESFARKRLDSNIKNYLSEVSLHTEKKNQMEILGIFEKAVSTIRFSEELGKCEENDSAKGSTRKEMLNNEIREKYALLKGVILDQLISTISMSTEERITRASVSILSTLVLENKSVIEDIKKKGVHLCDLASALKRNVHEAAILIYLINPSPIEIKELELLPALLEVVCNSNSHKQEPALLPITPSAASLKMIEVLVTAFDYATNNVHLAAISPPWVLSGLTNVVRNKNSEELIPLISILIKCMRYDGKCRNFLSQFTPMDPFVSLLRRKRQQAKFTALEFFHEILRMPRSSAISLLHQIRRPDSLNILHILMSCIQHSQPEYRLLAANLLLQLDMLEDSSGKSIFREEAMEVLLESVASEENSATQILSSFILSNLGGTYAWTGEPYTVAWLVKRAGLTSLYQRNMIKNYDWSDQSLQDPSTDVWCSKIAKSIIKIGNPVFHALAKGLQSKIKSVSHDCLVAIAWLGYEVAASPSHVRYSACEILLTGIKQFLHPGLELEKRLLACLCVYNYASGTGMQKLTLFPDGVRESLRRLSSITWMAEELLKVTDYFLPINSRVSCVHTQILEAAHKCSGAASALIYYKGLLYSGYSDGSIKVWDIKGQIATLVWDIKKHKRAVTCFALFEPGNSLLSGSSDKTIRVWQMVQKKLECLEVIETNVPICKMDTHEQLIFVVSQSHGIKVFDMSRKFKFICKSKHVKCITVVQGRIYVGCMDSSIQEVDVTNDREREIKAPAKGWRMQASPINAVLAYKDWLYSASATVEGSKLQEWRRHNKPQMSITTGRGTNVQAMGIVEDFIYLNCSSSPNELQIWLRGTQRKVGRLSAGSRITSLLTANDIVLCGTETGLIKGWIPL